MEPKYMETGTKPAIPWLNFDPYPYVPLAFGPLGTMFGWFGWFYWALIQQVEKHLTKCGWWLHASKPNFDVHQVGSLKIKIHTRITFWSI